MQTYNELNVTKQCNVFNRKSIGYATVQRKNSKKVKTFTESTNTLDIKKWLQFKNLNNTPLVEDTQCLRHINNPRTRLTSSAFHFSTRVC